MGDPRIENEESSIANGGINVPIDKDSKLWRSAEPVEEPDDAQINGQIPEWLNGYYLRVGPGKFDLSDTFTVGSWLDGLAIASKFTINGQSNSVSFQSKYLESQAYKGAIKTGKLIFPEYGTKKHSDSGKGFFSSLVSNFVPEMSDNPTTAYLHFDSSNTKLFVGGESCYFHEYDHHNLALGERFDSKELFGFQLCAIHPLVDPVDGSIYNIGTSILTGVRYNIFKICPNTLKGGSGKDVKSNQNHHRHHNPSNINKESFKKSFKLLTSISSRWSTGMAGIHSFGQTTNYIIFIEQPYIGNIKKALGSAVRGRIEALSASMEWYPEACNRFYIVSKSTGEILNKSFEILSDLPFFFVHMINCYEEIDIASKTSFVVIDVSCFDNPDTLSAQNLEQLRSSKYGFDCNCTGDTNLHASGQRFIIPCNLDVKKTLVNVNLLTLGDAQQNEISLPSNTPSSINKSIASAVRKGKSQIILTSKLIMRKGLELPIINSAYSGKSYQYYYASGLVTLGEFQNSIVKVDVKSCEATIFKESPYYIFGEPIFVSKSKNKEVDGSTEQQLKEDDGVIIVPMTDSRKDKPDMIFFLNATDMSELGRAIFNERIPPSIHGTFIPKSNP